MSRYIKLDTIKIFLDKDNNALEALPLLVKLAEDEPGYFQDDFIIDVPPNPKEQIKEAIHNKKEE